MPWCLWLFLSRGRMFHFPLVNLSRFLQAISPASVAAAQPPGALTTPPTVGPAVDLLRAHSALSCSSFLKLLNRMGPTTDPWGTLLVTGLQLGPLTTTLWSLYNPPPIQFTLFLPSASFRICVGGKSDAHLSALCRRKASSSLRGC